MSGTTEVTYGLTPQGFVRKRLPEIQSDMRARFEAATGEKWNWNEDSFIGLLFSIFSDELAKMWELQEEVHLSMYPASASGVALDRALSFSGVRRKFDTPTQVLALLYGAAGTTIPAGSQARSAPTDGSVQKTFTLQEDVTISQSAAAFIAYDVAAMPAGFLHSLTVNGVSYSWLGLNTSAADAAQGLANVLTQAGFSVVRSNSRLTLTAPLGTVYGLVPSSNLSPVSIAGVGLFSANVLGPVPLDALELTTMVTNVIGWARVANPQAGVTGRTEERDAEVQARYGRGVFELGGGSVAAISANLERWVVGVEEVQVYENFLDVQDDQGRLPHSIEVVIEGGLDVDIAKEIYRVKGGGIRTNGSTVVQVKSKTGTLVPISFNRPAPVFIWMIVDLTLYPEEVLAPDATIRIRQALADAVNANATGKDFLWQRYLRVIFDASPGTARASIRSAAVPTASLQPSPGAYGVNDISVSPRQRTRTAPDLIVVNIL